MPSRVIKAKPAGWQGVEPTSYKPDDPATTLFCGVERHSLLGDRADEAALGFVVRCFELEPAGMSSLERHGHPHAVVVIRGRGEVILGDRVEVVGPLDTVFVAPWTWHQFHASQGEGLAFLCMVPRERDRPQVASATELAALAAEPALHRLLAPLARRPADGA
jgi:quercetin dioxygenase-like cupin family protein